jgi:hypothetical protein
VKGLVTLWVLLAALTAQAEEECVSCWTDKCTQLQAYFPACPKKARPEPVRCAAGQSANEDTQGHCCWPGQGWARSKKRCVGIPASCPADRVVSGEDCVPTVKCPAGTAWDGKVCRAAGVECPPATTWNGHACDPLLVRVPEGACDSAASCRNRCQNGEAPACYALGTRFEEDLSPFQKGCDLAHGPSCTAAGVLYSSGKGVAGDRVRGVALYQKACALGDARGCTFLGVALESGSGVALQPAEAAAAFKRGCASGSASACAFLGELTVAGRGVPVDVAGGRALYQQGCTGGSAWACAQLK